MSDKIKRTVTTDAQGRQVVETSFEVTATRPVRDDVVEALDAALARLGGNAAQVMHAMDPSRILPFSHGGPPVWSVGMVPVAEPRPYTLLVTYGLSHTLSPEPEREGVTFEYSLAVPKGVPLQPWADAFLRHQCRYVLNEGMPIRVNDCVPFRGMPMTRIPFQPQHHAQLPDSTLVGILCAPDPVLPTVATPHGPIEVRRLVGIDAAELDRAETWSAQGFLAQLTARDPLLLSDIGRQSWMADASFRGIVDKQAAEQGSEIDAALFDFAWSVTPDGLVIELPQGRAAKRLLDAVRGRVGFGRRLGAFSERSPMIAFEPERTGIEVTKNALVFGGGINTPAMLALLAALGSGAPRLVLK